MLDKDADIVNMKPLADDGDTYIIYNDGYKDEFYLLENRQKQGNEAGLYASGLMITHVDYSQEAWEANDVNTTRESYAIMAADNSKARTIPDVEGDLYPFNGNNSFGNTTIPAATLNHANTDGSKLRNKEISLRMPMAQYRLSSATTIPQVFLRSMAKALSLPYTT